MIVRSDKSEIGRGAIRLETQARVDVPVSGRIPASLGKFSFCSSTD